MNQITRLLILPSILLLVASAAAQRSPDPAEDFYKMTKAAPAAFQKGEFAKAAAVADALLVEAERWPRNWNYGNAVHVANLVLGRIALANDDRDKAVKFLIAAGKTPGSPQLNTFGPDMVFAKEMLQKGETEAVIAYLDLCGKFWEKRFEQLDEWKEQIARGEIPDFGANLRYYF